MTALTKTTHRVNKDKMRIDWVTVCSMLLTVVVTVAALCLVLTADVPTTIEEAARMFVGR